MGKYFNTSLSKTRGWSVNPRHGAQQPWSSETQFTQRDPHPGVAEAVSRGVRSRGWEASGNTSRGLLGPRSSTRHLRQRNENTSVQKCVRARGKQHGPSRLQTGDNPSVHP